VASRLKTYPAVTLLGPRQSGKTTLAKTLSRAYYDLEIDQENLRLDLQWIETAQAREPVILDAAQNYRLYSNPFGCIMNCGRKARACM
jgi:predicted AAA+ superfamily ATPase